MTPVETEGASLLHVILAFSVVIALLGLFGVGLRYVVARGIKMPGLSNTSKRLQMVESLAIDVRRRLVIVRCDNKEHLLLLGTASDLVVAEDIVKDPSKT